MAVTLKEVATRAGVSPRTVSNVINDFPYVSQTTREAVLRAVAELGYRPNLVARQLRSGRTGVVGLLLPSVREQYFAALADAVGRAGQQRGWSVAIEQTDGAPTAEMAGKATLDHLWDGAIVSAVSVAERDLAQGTTPLVVLGEHGAEFDLAWVGADNKAAARDATSHLIDAGRTRIAVIGHQRGPGGETGALRTAGFRARMRSAKLKVSPAWVVQPDGYGLEQGYRAMGGLLDLPRRDRPDAVLCYNDELALGALRALHDRGVDVPGEIALMGWDDLPSSGFTTPRLTSVSVPVAEVAEAAVDQLAQQIAAGRRSREHIVVPHQIVARESTRA